MSKVAKKTYLTPRGDSKTVTSDATGLRFTFANGIIREVLFADFGDNTDAAAMRHGYSQKFGDSYASAVTVAEAIEALDDTVRQVKAGDWNTRQQAGITKLARLVLAVCRVQGIEPTDAEGVEGVTEKLTDMDEKKLEALSKSPQVVAALAAIEAERKAQKAEAASEFNLDDFTTKE